MFKKLREKIERALASQESKRPLSRDELDRLLGAMRQELIDLRARIPLLERDVERQEAAARRQIERAELAHEKAQAAERSGAAGDARVALEAARGALAAVEDLRRQAAESAAEVERLKAEYAEKLEQLKEAERNRSALVARSRRAGTARKLDELLKGPESGLRRFEKAEEDIETAEDMAVAERELAEAMGERPPLAELEADRELKRLEAAKEAEEIERKLAELKRELGADSD